MLKQNKETKVCPGSKSQPNSIWNYPPQIQRFWCFKINQQLEVKLCRETNQLNK